MHRAPPATRLKWSSRGETEDTQVKRTWGAELRKKASQYMLRKFKVREFACAGSARAHLRTFSCALGKWPPVGLAVKEFARNVHSCSLC